MLGLMEAERLNPDKEEILLGPIFFLKGQKPNATLLAEDKKSGWSNAIGDPHWRGKVPNNETEMKVPDHCTLERLTVCRRYDACCVNRVNMEFHESDCPTINARSTSSWIPDSWMNCTYHTID